MERVKNTWSLMKSSFPVLVIENKGLVSSLKESAGMLKHSWGEQLIGHFSIGLIYFLLLIPGVFVIGFMFLFAEIIGLMALGFFMIYVYALGIIQWILQSIFMGAVYLYVREDKIPDAFSVSQFDQSML